MEKGEGRGTKREREKEGWKGMRDGEERERY